MGGGPANGVSNSDLFQQGATSGAGVFSSADMASGPSGQDDWARGAGSAAFVSANQQQFSLFGSLSNRFLLVPDFCLCQIVELNCRLLASSRFLRLTSEAGFESQSIPTMTPQG